MLIVSPIAPIAMIVGLGGLVGYVCHRYIARFWLATFTAAGIATILWGGAIYILFFATAPNELGPPLPGPVILTYLLSAISASAVGFLIRKTKSGDESHG